jgi:hypothetical protein
MLVTPFVLNALHAKIAEAVGFEAVYMTGAGTAAERGFPDVGLLTLTEMVSNARYIANAVRLPVICDADTGYGNLLNVQHTVWEYEVAGGLDVVTGYPSRAHRRMTQSVRQPDGCMRAPCAPPGPQSRSMLKNCSVRAECMEIWPLWLHMS